MYLFKWQSAAPLDKARRSDEMSSKIVNNLEDANCGQKIIFFYHSNLFVYMSGK